MWHLTWLLLIRGVRDLNKIIFLPVIDKASEKKPIYYNWGRDLEHLEYLSNALATTQNSVATIKQHTDNLQKDTPEIGYSSNALATTLNTEPWKAALFEGCICRPHTSLRMSNFSKVIIIKLTAAPCET